MKTTTLLILLLAVSSLLLVVAARKHHRHHHRHRKGDICEDPNPSFLPCCGADATLGSCADVCVAYKKAYAVVQAKHGDSSKKADDVYGVLDDLRKQLKKLVCKGANEECCGAKAFPHGCSAQIWRMEKSTKSAGNPDKMEEVIEAYRSQLRFLEHGPELDDDESSALGLSSTTASLLTRSDGYDSEPYFSDAELIEQTQEARDRRDVKEAEQWRGSKKIPTPFEESEWFIDSQQQKLNPLYSEPRNCNEPIPRSPGPPRYDVWNDPITCDLYIAVYETANPSAPESLLELLRVRRNHPSNQRHLEGSLPESPKLEKENAKGEEQGDDDD